MQLKISYIGSIIGALGVITCIQSVPIEVIYTGDTCACPKKLDYVVNMPITPIPKPHIPSELGYKLECPLNAKARITYSFDFTVEEPKPKPPMPEEKYDIYAKIDRITAHKKDCYEAEELPKTCGCYQCALGNRYALPDYTAERYSRDLRHLDSVDTIETSSGIPPTTHILAIFMKPLNQPKVGAFKTRNKRDISHIFTRPRKNEKRSDRLVKKYNSSLKDIAANEKKLFDDTPNPIRRRGISPVNVHTVPNGLLPLQKLSSFLTLPNLRNKRDIKGEYDLIEKDREQIDLTLPEIIQYMPETLDPNFKRNQCNFGQNGRHSEVIESTSKATTTEMAENIVTMATTESGEDTTPANLNVTVTNSLRDKEEVKQKDNEISSTPKKRNAGGYEYGGCPIVLPSYNPTPNPGFSFEPLTNYEPLSSPFATSSYPYAPDPASQQYVGSFNEPYSPQLLNDSPLLGAAYGKPTASHISNAELDRIITTIINKHADFLDASSHRNGALVDPPEQQEEQAKYFLKSLIAGPWKWSRFGENQYQYQYPRVHAHLRHYHEPHPDYVRPFAH